MKVDKHKIERFAEDKFSFKDYLSMSEYFEKSEYNESLKENLFDDWERISSSNARSKSLAKVLERIHVKIKQNDQSRKSTKIVYQLMRIAAILFLPALLTIGVLIYNAPSRVDSDAWVKIVSPIGSRTQFHLPDGSEGWLNSGSYVKYPVAFNKNRVVEIRGEAWFDVTHRDNMEFRVKTSCFDVRVLGTQFNVVDNDDKFAEVVLERGKVVVEGVNNSFNAELKPDEQLVFDKQSIKAYKSQVDSKSLNYWRRGELIFKNQPMEEIARRLERNYNVNIVLHGEKLKRSIFRATFQDENIEEIMKLLSTVAPIRYELTPRKILSDSSFSKGKIEIWLKN